MPPSNYNSPVEGIPFFAPKHNTSPGTPFDAHAKVPTLFTPLRIRGTTLRNRIAVAPMCQYSTAETGATIGALTPYHVATLGHYALKDAALIFIEATGEQPNGRISPNCPGAWSDSQIDGIKAVADFIHSQGALCGLQLAHAGRKASTVPAFIASQSRMPSRRATEDVGGWPREVVGPSGGEEQTWDGRRNDDPEGGFFASRELSVGEIKDLYLIHQFLSPITNRRTDAYGGPFENRTRLLLEIIRAIRDVIPPTTPLFLRLSATEWMEETELRKRYGSWDVESTIQLAKIVSELGVDLLDVSSGGNHPQQRIDMFHSKDYQTKIAARIRREHKAARKQLLIGAVGLITEAEQARDIVEDADRIQEEAEAARQMTEKAGGGREPTADIILVARQFMREPEWVLKAAWKLRVDIAWPSHLPKL